MFSNSNCVEIENKYSFSEFRLRLVVEILFKLNLAVTLPSDEPHGDLCRSVLVLLGEEAPGDFEDDLRQKADRRSTVTLIVDSEEIQLWFLEEASADEIFDIFAFADAFLVSNSSVYQLSSPASANRHFSVVSLKTVRMPENKTTMKLPNFEEKLLRVATFDCPVGVFVKTVNNKSVMYDGLELAIFNEMRRRLNFTYELAMLIDENNKWGVLLPNGTWSGGIIGNILHSQRLRSREQRVDIGFCGVWKIDPQSRFVDLTLSLIQEKNCFLVRRLAELKWSWMSPFTEFQPTVWLCIGAIFLLQASLLYTSAQISKQCPSFRLTRYFRLSSCLMEILGIHMLSSAPNWKRKSAYLLMIQFYSLVITTSYTSYILNRLLTPHVIGGVSTIQQLIEGNYYWGKPYPPSAFLIQYKAEHQPFIDRRRLLSKAQIDRLLATDDKFALVVGTVQDTLIKTDVAVNVSLLQRRRYRAVPDDLQQYDIAFALRRHSPYTPVMDRLLMRVASSGLLIYWINDLAAKHKDEVLSARRRDFYDTSFKALTLQNLKGVVALLLIGHSLATCVLIMELVHHRKQRKKTIHFENTN
ncbi:uncharacterized protein LOC111054485 [Nilaparvata lugens]|uniref:uncharacterized protein LOC111054485 n=1 Tax=Nilaparvata lugens TaxID=108931 RepID=UPI00193C9582|nr:uncharacterized protein LOC111054485 [Nilaparvata lugens]